MKRTTGIWCLAVVVIGAVLLWSNCGAKEAPSYDSYQAPIPKSPHPDDAGIYVTQEKSMFVDVPDSAAGGGARRFDRGRFDRHDREGFFKRLFKRLMSRRAERKHEREPGQ